MFSKILIANRGEIAVRVALTCKRLGVRTVAVFSQADRHALHVKSCDEAVFIGPAPASESYLVIDKIIAAAKQTGAEAIHPGYGFLSENAKFADACAQNDIVFIGPKPDTIRAMGDKAAAKAMMREAGVPVLPGYDGDDQSLKTFQEAAERIGFPVLFKAVAGGGGKGMRLVERAGDVKDALAAAKREAQNAFGDDRFLVEKFVRRPRHVEVQLLGDTRGNLVHLWDRDCSVQRRHQKVIEEAPAPSLPDAVRQRLHDAAIKAGKAVDYVSAGTVEFLYDPAAPEEDAVYFMEMNTRLQVEHPVTEEINDRDLVELQLRVAAGGSVFDDPDDGAREGVADPPRIEDFTWQLNHSIEARLYAENPEGGFLPSTGRLERLSFPEALDATDFLTSKSLDTVRLRIDAGVEEGQEVTPNYDPMIAKIIATGPSRQAACRELARALEQIRIAGVTTNATFLHAIVSHPAFVAGELSTHFIDEHRDELFAQPDFGPLPLIAACAAVVLDNRDRARRLAIHDPTRTQSSPWSSLSGFRLNAPSSEKVELTGGDQLEQVSVSWEGIHARLTKQGAAHEALITVTQEPGQLRIEHEGRARVLDTFVTQTAVHVWLGSYHWTYQRPDPDDAAADSHAAGGSLAAPMPGLITSVAVRAGDKVVAGQTLLTLEAMKMEHAIAAPSDGVVAAVNFKAGDQVKEGDELAALDSAQAMETAS